MTQNWRDVWNRRTGGQRLGLAELIALDGFDSGAGRIEVDDWRAYARLIGKMLALQDGHSVYEVGCGSGAFLYSLREQCKLRVGGIDFSQGLIDAAGAAMPDGNFDMGDAKDLSPAPAYDFVIANSVFHYFSMADAAVVLDVMLKKARIGVVITDVPDVATKAQCEALRRDKLSHAEYEKKYAGLEHTYYPRSWFEQQASDRQIACRVFDGCVPNYAQNQFRFSAVITKNS